jgi:hypothetical protein
MYRKTRREGWFTELTGGFMFQGEPEIIDHRPLIEAPAVVRLRTVEVLPDLVKAIADTTKGPKTRAKEASKSFAKAMKVYLRAMSKPVTEEKKKNPAAKQKAQ